jgi:hypothetical protein
VLGLEEHRFVFSYHCQDQARALEPLQEELSVAAAVVEAAAVFVQTLLQAHELFWL